jgi:OHCU decarboxylase
MPFSIAKINELDESRFVETLGWIFEHSPWVAKRAWRRRPFTSAAELAECMNVEVAAAPMEDRLALLRAHPDLGTRAKISASSADEQAGAGLDRLTVDEHKNLMDLNAAYKQKFGFPFLYAVRGSDKFAILEALGRRLGSSAEEEFEEALNQVYRIARFRLESVIDERGT